METIFNTGIDWIVFLQNMGQWLTGPMKVLTFLGSGEFFLMLIPALYWSIDSRIGIRVGMVFLISGAFIEIMKIAFHHPRPYWFSTLVRAYSSEVSFGAPSGHTQLSVGLYGMLAYCLKKWWGWLAAVILVLLIGVSRLYLAVHFPHDVILGLVFGAIVLGLTIVLWDPVVNWLKHMTTTRQILVALAFSLFLIALNLPGYLWLKQQWQLPVEWSYNAAQVNPADNPINPLSLELLMTYTGIFFGLAAGLAWLQRMGGFSSKGTTWQRLLRYVVGIAGVLIIRYGLKVAFPGGDSWLAYFLHYVRYAVIGLWVTAGAPLVFFWLRLANRSPRLKSRAAG